IFALQGKTESLSSLNDENYDEEKINSEISQSLSIIFAWQSPSKVFLLILDEKLDEAYDLCLRHLSIVENISNYYPCTLFHFFLAYCSLTKEKKDYDSFLIYYKMIEDYQSYNPETYGHLYLILKALDLAHSNQFSESITYIEEATSIAKSTQNPHFAALAQETLAQLWINQKQIKYGLIHLKEARQYYLDWGAIKKVERITELLKYYEYSKAEYNNLSSSSISQRISFQSIIESISAMTKESSFKEIQITIFKILILNTAAQEAEFYNYRKSQWKLFARGTHKNPEVFRPALLIDHENELPLTLLNSIKQNHAPINLSLSCDYHVIKNDAYLKIKPYKSILAIPSFFNNELIGVMVLYSSVDQLFSDEIIPITELLMTQAMISLNQSFQHLQLTQSKQHVKKQNRYLKSLLNSISDAIIVMNPHGVVKSLNSNAKGLCKSSNHKQNDFLGLFPISFLDESELLDLNQLCNIHQGRNYHIQIHLDHLKHSIFFLKISKIFDENEQVSAYLFSISDVSKQKQLEAKLLQAQKLESIGRLAGALAHDFNNMIGVIMGSTELISLHVNNQNQVKKYAKIIKQSAEVAKNLTRNLLDFSRKGKTVNIKFNLEAQIKQSIDIFTTSIQEDQVNFITSFSPDPYSINGDPSQILNLLINLYKNSLEAIETASTIQIETTLLLSFKSENALIEFGDYILLKISDNGPGIDPEILPYIFDPFFTTKTQQSGTGLGLASVHGIISDHMGTIEVESDLYGTRFNILLPISVDQGKIMPRSEEILPKVHDTKHTILLVDDDILVSNVTAEMIEYCGYNVVQTKNGQEALDYYAKHRDIFAILSDFKMPVMSGEDLFYQVKKLNPQVKFILYSGFCDSKVINSMKEQGLLYFLKKPLQINEVQNMIEIFNA
ncbi:ATP-binding protein, partial [bacterium]|nr:ATP-binding protein [bacterium]